MWNIFWRMISVPRLRRKSKKTATKNITVLLHRPVKHRSSPGQKWSGRRSLPLRRRIRGYVLRHGSSRWKHSGTEDWFFTPQYGLADMVKNRPEPMKFAGFRYHGRKAAMKKVSQRYTEFLQVYFIAGDLDAVGPEAVGLFVGTAEGKGTGEFPFGIDHPVTRNS